MVYRSHIWMGLIPMPALQFMEDCQSGLLTPIANRVDPIGSHRFDSCIFRQFVVHGETGRHTGLGSREMAVTETGVRSILTLRRMGSSPIE